MTAETKISSAFDPFFSKSDPDDKLRAVVIYDSPEPKRAVVRGGSLQKRENRLEYVASRAKKHQSIEKGIFKDYRKAAGDAFTMASIGSSALPAATVEVNQDTLHDLANHPDVVAVMPNQPIHSIQPSSVDYANLDQEPGEDVTWGLKQLQIEKMWETTKGARNSSEGGPIKVAVLDTGVYGGHPALKGQVEKFVLFDTLGRKIFLDPEEGIGSFDAGEHGTHVCGTIAGKAQSGYAAFGVAPEAKLLVGGVLVGKSTLATLMEGITWAIEEVVDVINMSLGFTYYEEKFEHVFDRLLNHHILPVVAIGNANHGNTSSPGNAPNAFSVGAVQEGAKDEPEVAHFSGGASLVFPGKPRPLVTKPDVVAPGMKVLSCVPDAERADASSMKSYAYMDGTSMATPHVAGVAALLMAATDAPVADIITALKEKAKHPDGVKNRPDNRWGYGMIQPVEALKVL